MFFSVAFIVAWWCSWLGVYNSTSCWRSFKRLPPCFLLHMEVSGCDLLEEQPSQTSFQWYELCGSFLILGTKWDCYLTSSTGESEQEREKYILVCTCGSDTTLGYYCIRIRFIFIYQESFLLKPHGAGFKATSFHSLTIIFSQLIFPECVEM